VQARRQVLKFGLAAFGAALLPGRVLADTGPRRVAFHNLHTGEAVDALYFDKGEYVPDALAAINKVLRDFRTGDVHPMDKGLVDLLAVLSTKVDSKGPFQIISGYRSPKTNAMLHAKSDGVAARSLHMDGLATDIRLDGVQLRHLHKAALSLGRGGVGLYPTSNFVHVDVGRVRSWQGV
jgi:uncharacterized protein YcbK (DUF882 family)